MSPPATRAGCGSLPRPCGRLGARHGGRLVTVSRHVEAKRRVDDRAAREAAGGRRIEPWRRGKRHAPRKVEVYVVVPSRTP